MRIAFQLFVCLLLCLTSFSEATWAQKSGKTSTTPPTSPKDDDAVLYQKMYAMAMKYGDYVSASQSVYALLAMDTGNLALKDTLANLFFARGAYNQCIQVGEEIFARQPDNNRILELLAVSEQSLGKSKESLGYYEKLYPRTKELYYLYQMVVLQYGLKRVGECNANIELILNDPNSEKQLVAISIGQGYQQQVPYKAAALNIRGVIAKEIGDSESAKKCFEEALKVSPEFVLAKGNLDELVKPDTKSIKPPMGDMIEETRPIKK